MKCLDKVTAQEIPVDLGCLGTSGLTPCNECYECQKRFPIVPLQHCTITIARQVIRNDRVATTRVIQGLGCFNVRTLSTSSLIF